MTTRYLRQLRTTFARLLARASLAGIAGSAGSGPLSAQPAAPSDPAPLISAASQALAEGSPFRASRTLAPLLASPGGRDPALVLLAARAASRWDAWATVVRLLRGQPWIDRVEDGEGRALLARALVERGDDALADARAAVTTAPTEMLGPRLVTLARAFDRANLLDSALLTYRRAGVLLPLVGDWLRLRAAGVTADSAERAALYREVTLAAAVPRIRWTEALAQDRTGSPAGAAQLYESLGATLAAVRLRLRAAPDSTGLAAIRRELVGALTPRRAPDDARDAIALLDANFSSLTAQEELVVARRAAAVDRLFRAADGFGRALKRTPPRDADRLTYGTVLARLGRHREAIAILAAIRDRELRPQAEFLRAKSLLRTGPRAAGLAALRRVAAAPVSDTATAATAAFLLADLLVDDGNDGGARVAYLAVARRFPGTTHGARAAFQAALLEFLHGSARVAASEFGMLAERSADRSEGIAALYWSGRALLAARDSTGARVRWKSVVERFPNSYYAIPSASRLGLPGFAAGVAAAVPARDDGVDAALDRGALLERIGLRVEARFEFDRVARDAENGSGGLLAAATAFLARGLAARAYHLALRAEPRGASPDGAVQRLLFPVPLAAELANEAHRVGIDPLLVAALIRQESGFDPQARSAADARGLMQVLPSLGAALARAEGVADWDTSLLYQPEVNLHFGVVHLNQALRRYPRLEPALAAYNAGAKATEQWLALPGAANDPEVFMERIQFVETRDYVRRILRNVAVYRALYPAGP